MNTKFVLQIDNHINWKNHMKQMIPKSSVTRYAVRSMVYTSSLTL